MVVDTLKQLLPRSDQSPARLKAIVDVLRPDEANRARVDDVLMRAYRLAEKSHQGQTRKSGDPYFEHCYQVALLLAQWRMDHITIAAGLLHDTMEDTGVTAEELAAEFGPELASLVGGVTKLAGLKFRSRAERQAENYMKMLLSVVKDIRVIIIKFADRLHNMRTIEHLPLIKQRRIAIETRDVYAPLAHRLGMAQVKWDMEDMALRTLDPSGYKEVVRKVRSTRSEREHTIEGITKPISKLLAENGIRARIKGRAKHTFSIYGKMKRRQVEFEEIYDLLAIRVIVERVEECYAALGILHQLFTPVQERFKDFIATPKINGYQSLHTTVVGPRGKGVEIQIRTEEMDQTAEIGIAAHWRYKEGSSGTLTSMDRQVRWLRELVEMLQNENATPEDFLDLLKIDLFRDEIFIFTPKGDLVQLAVGSTPVDMAFEIHTEVGLQCVGARVNGKIVPLNTQVKSGDNVEIITSEHQTPSSAWLKFVQTGKARTHIRRYLRRIQLAESIKLGKEIAEKSLRRLKRAKLIKAYQRDPQKLGYETLDAVHAALGRGDLTVRQMIEKLEPNLPDAVEPAKKKWVETLISRRPRSAEGVRVDGVPNLLLTMGKCCHPLPGDEIIGFVTRGHGVTVHRVSCSNLPTLSRVEDRFVAVEWDVAPRQDFRAYLKLVAEDRRHFLNEVTEATSKLNINIVSVDLTVDEGILTCVLALQVDRRRKLERLQDLLRKIPGLIQMERI